MQLRAAAQTQAHCELRDKIPECMKTPPHITNINSSFLKETQHLSFPGDICESGLSVRCHKNMTELVKGGEGGKEEENQSLL